MLKLALHNIATRAGSSTHRRRTAAPATLLGVLLSLALAGAAGYSPGAHAQIEGDGSGITVNFKDTEIREIIEAVAEITGKSFIIDSRVKGQATLISKSPLTPDAFYETFLAILQVNGFVAVPSGNVVKVLPDTNARQLPSIDLPGSVRSGSDQIVTHVIQVQNVGAAQLVPILRPLVPQYGHLAAHPASNMLIISDREANVYRLLKIISRIDQSSDEDIEVIPLEHATASELVRILTTLNQAANRGGDAAPSPFVLAADERTNSILISGERTERLRFRTLIAHLDTPLEAGGDTQVIYLNYADAEELASKLTEQVTATTGAPSAGGAAQAAAARQQGSTIIWADPATNALVITAPPKVMRSLRSVIGQLDIRRAQVELEAIIVDVSDELSAELGVSWAIDGTDDAASIATTNYRAGGNSILDFAAVATQDNIGADAVSIIQDGITFGVGRVRDSGTNFAILLNALSGDAKTNILSTPTVVTMDNEEAELSVGQQVPFLTGSFSNTGATTGGVNPFQTIQRQDVGLSLKVTPQINEGNAVILDLELEVSSISQGSQGAVDLITNRRNINQKVIIEDGGIIVLGGLIDEMLVQSQQRVPILGRIPVIKHLFSSTSSEKIRRNLMVFMRPRILRDGVQAAFETNSKYRYIRELQTGGDTNIPLLPGTLPPAMPPLEDVQHPELLNVGEPLLPSIEPAKPRGGD